MICLSVMYPNTPGKKFDHDYYANNHMPMVLGRLKDLGMTRYEIDRGVSAGAPGSAPAFVCIGRCYFETPGALDQSMSQHGAQIMADIPNYTDIQPSLQVGETS